VARAAVAAVIPWMSGIAAQSQTFATGKGRRRHPGYLTEPQQSPWAFVQPTAQIKSFRPAIEEWERAGRTPRRKPQHPGYLTEPQQSPWIRTQVDATVSRWGPAFQMQRDSYTTKRDKLLPSLVIAPDDGWVFSSVPAFNAAFGPAFELLWARMRARQRLFPHTVPNESWMFSAGLFPAALWPSLEVWPTPRVHAPGRRFLTPGDDGWLFSGIPAGGFDASLWAALDVFSQRMTYRTGRVPHEGDGGADAAPGFSASLWPSLETFAAMMARRKGFYQYSTSQEFGWALETEVVWPAVAPMFERMRQRRRGWPIPPFDTGWLFTSIPSTFDPALWPAFDLLSAMTRRRGRLYPSTAPDGGWLFSALFNPSLWPSFDLFAQRAPRRARPFPSTDTDPGWIFTGIPPAFNPALFAAFELLSLMTKRRSRGLLDVPVNYGWLTDSTTFHPEIMAALELLSQRMGRRRDHDARIISPNDDWLFTSIPPVVPGAGGDYIPTWRPRRR